MTEQIPEATRKITEGFIGQQMIVLPPDIIQAVTKNPLINRFYLTSIGYYPRAVYHDRERKNGSGQYILLYCVDGKGYIRLGGKKHLLGPNSYFIIPAGVPHHYTSSHADPWSIYWAHFTGEQANILYDRYRREAGPEVLPIPFDEHRTALFTRIFPVLENSYNPRHVELSNILLLQFLTALIYHEEMHPSYFTADRISLSIQFMKEHLHQCYSIHELAAALNYSVSHYTNLFKKDTGMPPIQYFNLLKIQKSCQYLYFTDMNIKEICSRIGFDDPYYFSRMFKKLMGLSPAKYRGNHKKTLA